MYISTIRIRNYKSFYDSGYVSFKPGINVIIGPNNSGKTALLQALNLSITNNPHRSVKTIRERSSPDSTSRSAIDFTVTVESHELRGPFTYLRVPLIKTGRIDDLKEAFNSAVHVGLNLSSRVTPSAISKIVDYGLYEQVAPGNSTSAFVDIEFKSNGTYEVTNHAAGADAAKASGWHILEPFAGRIYRFEAERMGLSEFKIAESSPNLNPRATNLAEVLHVLQSKNPFQFGRFVRYVTDVIPSVKWVSAVTTKDQRIEIRVWPIDPETERDDLTVELSEAGTGIGQVLAMLYVVFTSEVARTIIIDEPQSFLHPGAVKKLMEIFQLFPQHQYFISTHSPDILSAINPATITALEYREGVSSAKSLSLNQTAELRDVLNEIGVRFGDVFFASHILWVEGQTEALSFPLILKTAEPPVTGVTVLPLVNTGDVKSKKHVKKHARLVFDIYNKLSGAHALVPPVVGVVLDREDMRSQDMRDLKNISADLLEFLPRRLYENYLLNPKAITAVANDQEGFRDTPLTAEEVTNWIQEKKTQGAYLDEKLRVKGKELTDSQWLRNVHGAKLLEDAFRHFSGVVTYIKTKHSVDLTSWLIQNAPSELKELREFLESVVTSQEKRESDFTKSREE